MSITMSTGREVLAATYLFVQVGASATVALLLCRRVASDRLERALAAVALFFVQAIGISIVLAMLTIFSLPAVLLGHLVVLGATVLHERRSTRPEPLDQAEGWSPWGLVAVGLGAALLLLSILVTLRGPITNDFDTREYHIANLAHFVQDGTLWTLPYAGPGSITATHPGNGELFDAWLTLPSHGDEIAYLGPTAFGALAILGAAVVARQLGGRKQTATGAMLGIAVLAAPIFFVTQTKSLASDMAASAPLIAGLAFTLIARKRPTPSPAIVLLAGATMGMGLGSKYTALAPGAILVLSALILLPRKVWAWLVPGLAVLGLPWFVRNLVQTGNPLFPLDLPGIQGGQTPIDILDQSMLDHFKDGNTDVLRLWVRLLARLIGPLLLLVIPGVALAWKRLADKRAAIVCSVLALLAVGGQLALPYTGGGPTGLDFLIASCFRYGLAAVLLGACVAAAALPAKWTSPLAAVCTAWALWRIEAGVVTNTQPITYKFIGLALVGGAVVAAALWFVAGEEARWHRAPAWLRRNLTLGAAAAAVIGLLGAGAAVFHKEDRGVRPLPLEALLAPIGWDHPALVMGAEDLRAILGPRLERPLAKVDRGGKADEIPFVTVNQIRHDVLGDDDVPPEPPELADELRDAVDDSGYDLLIVGRATPIAVPDGWEPSDRWCEAGHEREMVVYVTKSLLGLGATASCPAP